MNCRSEISPRLRAYEIPATRKSQKNGALFSWLLGISLSLFLGLGSALLAVDLPPLAEAGRNVQRTSFLVRERKPVVLEETPKEEVLELTTPPTEFAAPTPAPNVEVPEAPSELLTAAEVPPPEAKEQRRVYGVRKVFAKGLGEGNASGSGVFSTHGNSLDEDALRIEATEADLTGELVPLSAVSSAPVLIGRVKPQYTEEMLENRISGLVRARLLVDVDGSVQSVEILEDIGHGSRDAAASAFRRLRFEPAQRGNEPVAVWITMKFRFEIQE